MKKADITTITPTIARRRHARAAPGAVDTRSFPARLEAADATYPGVCGFCAASRTADITISQPTETGVHRFQARLLGAMFDRGYLHHFRVRDVAGVTWFVPQHWTDPAADLVAWHAGIPMQSMRPGAAASLADRRLPGSVPDAADDSELLACCTEALAIEAESNRLWAICKANPKNNQPAFDAYEAYEGANVGRLHDLIRRVGELPTRTRAGLKAKAAVARSIVPGERIDCPDPIDTVSASIFTDIMEGAFA